MDRISQEMRHCIVGDMKTPNMVVKIRINHSHQDRAQFQEIGKAYRNTQTNAVLIDLYGTQVISGELYLFDCPYHE